MDLPPITVVTVTCGRVHWLENAIHAFLRQDYAGPHELLILNTFPQQTLSIDPAKVNGKTVRIINLTERPSSLGKARNMVCEAATGRVIVILDDDDYILPHHLTTLAPNFAHGPLQEQFIGNQWVWMDKQFWGYGNAIKEIVKGQCPCFVFTKDVWKSVGGYPDSLTVGEDRAFINKITTKHPGKILPTPNPSFVYCWNNGAYHASGQGDDQPGRLGAHDRFWADVQRRVSCHVEPTGNITLDPGCRIDWERLAKDFMVRELKKNSENRLCVVQLGRYGDIVNILPILKHIAERYGKPHLMVSKEFASLLEGVSYVHPYPVDLANSDINGAIALAKQSFRHVIVTQIWGDNWKQEKKCESYNMESWRMAGFLHRWGNHNWRPLFDQRDADRERAIISKVLNDRRPLILANLTASSSSPFPEGQHIMALIRRKFQAKHNIMDLSEFRFHRIYDVLGLMEHAACLVTIDTSLLHLAAATSVPLVALVNPAPWLGSVPRLQYSARMSYKEAKVNPDAVVACMTRAIGSKRPLSVTIPPVQQTSPEPTIFHATETHRVNAPDQRREIAQASWTVLYDQGVVPCHLNDQNYPRTAQSSLKDPRPLPFLRDVLNEAKRKATKPNDIIVFTNDDNYLHPQLAEYLKLHVSLYDCCCAQRSEYAKGKPFPAANSTVEEFAAGGNPHMGRDLFAFSKQWLDAHWVEIPDFVLGASDWDLCMACMVRLHFGIESTRRNLEDIMFPAEIPRGYVSHQAHSAFWIQPSVVDTAPSQVHNRKLFFSWARRKLPQLKFHNNLTI